MSDSNETLDILAWRAAEDILRVREAGEEVNVAATAREFGVDRNRMIRLRQIYS